MKCQGWHKCSSASGKSLSISPGHRCIRSGFTCQEWSGFQRSPRSCILLRRLHSTTHHSHHSRCSHDNHSPMTNINHSLTPIILPHFKRRIDVLHHQIPNPRHNNSLDVEPLVSFLVELLEFLLQLVCFPKDRQQLLHSHIRSSVEVG